MPNYPAIYAIRAGLDYIQSVGVAAIYAAAQPLVHACLEGLRQLPVTLLTPPNHESIAGILAFRHPHFEAIQRRLHEQNIHVMAQAGRIRIAIHGYNTAADVETLLRVLSDTLRTV